MNFLDNIKGITEETRTVNRVPFPIDAYFEQNPKAPFPLAVLAEVPAVKFRVADKYQMLEGKLRPAEGKPAVEDVTPASRLALLSIPFTSQDRVYAFDYEIWPPKTDAGAKAQQVFFDRLAHLTEALQGPGSAATLLNNTTLNEVHTKLFKAPISNWTDYLNAVAYQLASNLNLKQVYRIKLTRSNFGKRPNDLQMPLGNVIERLQEGVKSILSVGPNDVFKMIEVPAAKPLYGNPTTTFGDASNPFPDNLG